MKIGLIDCDSYHFPNLPLMKLSAYYKAKGNNVEFAKKDGEYEVLFVSKILRKQKSRNFQKPELFSGEGVVMIWKIHFQTRLSIFIRITVCILNLQKTQHMDS